MKILKTLLLIFLMLTATVGGAGLRIWEFSHEISPNPNNQDNPGNRDNQNDHEAVAGSVVSEDTGAIDTIPYPIGTQYILIAGLDEFESVNRTDTLALAIIDWDGKAIRLLSIPRDSRVFIPGRKWDKINHAYAYGKMNLLKETVVNLFNIPIHHFLLLNMDGFPRIIDLMGGIEIDVERRMVYTDRSAKLFINIPKGPQHMNGKTALEYVRFRHDPLGDVGRVQRQQKFISVVMDKLKSLSTLTSIPNLVSEAISSVNSDLTYKEALGFLLFANSLDRGRIKMTMLPGKAAYVDNLSYWIPDIPQAMQFINGDIEDDDAPTEEDPPASELDQESLQALVEQIGKIHILNGDGTTGLAKRASQIFQKIGVDVAHAGNARHRDYKVSNVVYPENDKQSADALAQLCGITNKALIRKDNTALAVSIILGRDKDNIFKRLESAQLQF